MIICLRKCYAIACAVAMLVLPDPAKDARATLPPCAPPSHQCGFDCCKGWEACCEGQGLRTCCPTCGSTCCLGKCCGPCQVCNEGNCEPLAATCHRTALCVKTTSCGNCSGGCGVAIVIFNMGDCCGSCGSLTAKTCEMSGPPVYPEFGTVTCVPRGSDPCACVKDPTTVTMMDPYHQECACTVGA